MTIPYGDVSGAGQTHRAQDIPEPRRPRNRNPILLASSEVKAAKKALDRAKGLRERADKIAAEVAENPLEELQEAYDAAVSKLNELL